jgi:hypothetical protein
MMNTIGWNVRALGAAVLVAAAAGCTNPVSPGNHRVAAGVVVRDGADELVRATGDTQTGGLAVEAGSQTGALAVQFLTSDGSLIPVQDDYWLRVTSADSATAYWSQATPGEFGGRLVGVAAGATTLRFWNMHGAVGGGHDDGWQEVVVTVTAAP